MWIPRRLSIAVFCLFLGVATRSRADDFLRDLQTRAINADYSSLAHWGPDPASYTAWGSHSNRLIPVYTFGTKGAGRGVDLIDYTGPHSAFRSESALRQIFGRVPTHTLNPSAEYLDQTDLAALQRAAFGSGKKYVFLVIFDGMDWQTTQAAAIYNRRSIVYRAGRGTGLHFLDYTAGGTSQFGWMVTTPANDGTTTDVDRQQVLNPGGTFPGGYNAAKGGPDPWTPGDDAQYPIAKIPDDPQGIGEHAVPDSAATATAMCSGVKTYNNSINIDVTGHPVVTVSHEAQDRGVMVGVVTNVPISHATPACAYAHNVDRDDYQDLTRDLLGLPSIAHPDRPLPGVDVLIGGGFGDEGQTHKEQGSNFIPGNLWLTVDDRQSVDARRKGRYVVAERRAGVDGGQQLAFAAREAVAADKRLFGFFGNARAKGHLPFQTADGGYNPTIGRSHRAEVYTAGDLLENPTLAQMTSAALTRLEAGPNGFWLMVEAGDVDWANHDNNVDNSIGAVKSGDAAVKTITDWVEKHSNWNESLMIVTADHGHYLVLDMPERLTQGMTSATER
ncbi:MAG: alkaline phosphatase [Planctomycetaceae bacterium]|nr:alkaline phosphatase [Planctomycetaceae bacterium]